MAKMKGITPIIAILVLLLITVSIAGAAWAYISGYFGTIVSQAVEVTSIDCTSAGVSIFLNNIGSDTIYTNEVDLSRLMISGTCNDTIDVNFDVTEIGPGDTAIATDINCTSADDATPRYTIIAGGRVQKIQTKC